VVGVSAQTTQHDLDGQPVRGHPPTRAVSAVLDRLPPETDVHTAANWATLGRARDTSRVLDWVDRAAAEGVIVSEGER
jgi:hypothetical protein